ncbi:MAG: HAD family hydrolase [Treponema sp.]|nr:HAD family hydrolase [Treponema sp.]
MQIYQFPLHPKTLIFDIDSTLYTCPEYAHEQIDSQIRYFATLRNISPEDARALVSDYRKKWAQEHNGARISLGNLLLSFGISIEESIEWRKTLFNPADYLHTDSKLKETLTKLSLHYNLVCVTNNPVEPAQKTLDALGVSEQIQLIIGLDTCFKSKPAVEPLELAMEKTQSTAGECISIGDRYDIDIALPLKMGMGGILVSGVEEVYAIPEFLEGALS